MPVRVLELDVAGACVVPPVSARYDTLRLLARYKGSPLGVIRVPNEPSVLQPEALRERLVASFDREIWGAMQAERWSADDSRTNGFVVLPEVGVVVCTRDRPGYLERCLDALGAQRYPRFEVVVVDNAPETDATRDLVSRYAARYVMEPRRGLDWARNAGLFQVRAPIVAYTDDDARPDPGWLLAIARGFTSEDVLAVTGLVVPAELETRAQILYEDVYGGMGKGYQPELFSRRGFPMGYWPGRYGAGCNMAFRRDALEAIGGFDLALDVGTATGGGGDLDALQRIIEADGVIAYRPDAIVRHVHRRTKGKLRRQLFDNGRGHSAVLWAAMRRAHGRDRLGVLRGYWLVFRWWHARRFMRRVLRRDDLPLSMILIEMAGVPFGPLLYYRSRHQAAKLERVTGPNPAQ